MNSSSSRNLLLILLVFITILGIVLNEIGYLAPLEGLILRLISPLQSRLAEIVETSGGLFRAARELRDLRQRNEELEEQYAQLLIENVALMEAAQENATLRYLLNFSQKHPGFQFVGGEIKARVIGRDPSNFLRYLIIDAGTEQGVEKNMAVVVPRGLVGRVRELGPNWAKVLLITDPRSSVSGLIQSSRAAGQVQGLVSGDLVMKYISQEQKINENEIVLTSGLGGNLPKGLVIGQITAIEQRDSDMFQQATLRPTVDFESLEQVLVITAFEPVDVTMEKQETEQEADEP
ncbi:MAG: rod shape-determining protein MreC [Anaerolineaceae bacterium 4572_32.1]|nr:MAG: rod shape-determining protein MreC [Anaerolineaceae bacterium 4572_32.1]